jgi:hypothetical protein
MSISAKVVNKVLSWSSDNQLKNSCKRVLDTYVYSEPELTEEELESALKIYLEGLEDELQIWQ